MGKTLTTIGMVLLAWGTAFFVHSLNDYNENIEKIRHLESIENISTNTLNDNITRYEDSSDNNTTTQYLGKSRLTLLSID